jgi:hypothetical protein
VHSSLEMADRSLARSSCRGVTTFEYLLLLTLVALGLLGALRILSAGVEQGADAQVRAMVALTGGDVPDTASTRGPADPFPLPPGPPASEPQGCSNFASCAWEQAQQAASRWWSYETGVVGAAWDDLAGTVTGIKDFAVALFTDPKSIVTGAIDIADYVVHNPGEALKGLVWDEESSEAWANGERWKAGGRAAWNVVSWFIPGIGEAKIAAKLSKLSRAARDLKRDVPEPSPHPRDPDEPPACEGDRCEQADGTCFAAGTLVHTESGARAIEDVEPGDRVWSRDEMTGQTSLRQVTRTYVTPDQPVLELTVDYGTRGLETLTVTPTHPFWTGSAWVAAGDLHIDDPVTLLSGERVAVRALQPLAQRISVYNFEVEVHHTYFVGSGGVLVHNRCDVSPEARALARSEGIPLDEAVALAETMGRRSTDPDGLRLIGENAIARHFGVPRNSRHLPESIMQMRDGRFILTEVKNQRTVDIGNALAKFEDVAQLSAGRHGDYRVGRLELYVSEGRFEGFNDAQFSVGPGGILHYNGSPYHVAGAPGVPIHVISRALPDPP